MGFGKVKSKSPIDIVNKLKQPLLNLHKLKGNMSTDQKELEKLHDEVMKYFEYAKLTVYGDEQHPVVQERAEDLLKLFIAMDMLHLFAASLPQMLPDERLYTLQLFKAIARHPLFRTYGRPEKDKEEEDGTKMSQLNAQGRPLDKSVDKLSDKFMEKSIEKEQDKYYVKSSENSEDFYPNRLKKILIDELY